MKLEELGILLGYKCNYHCAHCLTNSSRDRDEMLSDDEVNNLISEIRLIKKTKSLKQIMFTGGEPSLYFELISKMLSSLDEDLEDTAVAITSNGSFIKDESKLLALSKLNQISKLRISLDEFHSEILTRVDLHDLKEFCYKNEIILEINCVMGGPMGYKYHAICMEEGINFESTFLIYAGRGKKLKTFPIHRRKREIDRGKTCGLLKRVLYVPGRGFTRCSRNLIWNTNILDPKIFGAKITDVFSNEFYNHITTTSFGHMEMMLKKRGVMKDFLSNCDLCEEYHKCI